MTERIIDMNGYMTIKANPISRAGVFPYLGKSIPGVPKEDADKMFYVLRPREELEDAETQASFAQLPIIDDHHFLDGLMTEDAEEGAVAPEDKVVHGTTGSAIDFRDDVLYSDIRIFSKGLKDRINSGKTGLSLGYRAKYEKKPGTFEGQAYDFVQRSLRGNHLALVDEPRNDVYVLDAKHAITFDSFELSLSKEEKTMADAVTTEPGAAAAAVATPEVTLESLGAQVAQLAEAVKVISEKVESMGEGAEEAAEEAGEAAATAEEATTDEGGEEGKKPPEGKKPVAATADKKTIDALEKKVGSLTTAMDEMKKGGIKSLMGEISKRDTLVQKVTPFVGTFDASEMTHDEVAAYAVKTLKLDCVKGQESAAIAGYLHGRSPAQSSAVFDSKAASPSTSPVGKYLAGKK